MIWIWIWMIEIVTQDTLALYGSETALSGRLDFFPLGIYALCLREYRHVAPTGWIYIWF